MAEESGMKKRIVLIGLGDNSKNLHGALRGSETITLVGVCDKDVNARGRVYYGGIPFFRDYRDILKCNPDYVYIATDPKSHAGISEYFIRSGVPVLCEKPPAASFEEYQQLVLLAESEDVFFNIVYHFRYSNEIQWLRELLPRLGRLVAAEAVYFDPYCQDRKITDGRESLGGCWLDSASNILSAWSYLFPNLEPKPLSHHFEYDKEFHLPIQSLHGFQSGNAGFQISIDWTQPIREKRMTFFFANNNANNIIHLDFTNQSVYLNGCLMERFHAEKSTPVHYRNFFAHFDSAVFDEQALPVTQYLYSF